MPIKLNINQTTEDRLQLGIAGGLIKQVNTDQIELRDAADAVYVRGYAFTPLGGDPANTIATKGYVDASVSGPQMQAGQATIVAGANGSVASTFAVAPPATSMVSRVKCRVSGGAFTAGTITVYDAGANPLAAFTGQLAADGDYVIDLGPQLVTAAGQFLYERSGPLAGPGTAVVFVEFASIPDVVSLP